MGGRLGRCGVGQGGGLRDVDNSGRGRERRGWLTDGGVDLLNYYHVLLWAVKAVLMSRC